jgi:hypothetical protein
MSSIAESNSVLNNIIPIIEVIGVISIAGALIYIGKKLQNNKFIKHYDKL